MVFGAITEYLYTALNLKHLVFSVRELDKYLCLLPLLLNAKSVQKSRCLVWNINNNVYSSHHLPAVCYLHTAMRRVEGKGTFAPWIS